MNRILAICTLTIVLLPFVSFQARADAPPGANTRIIEKSFSVSPAQRIEIKGFSGSRIRFTAWDKQEVSVHLSITSSDRKESRAQRYLDNARITEVRSADRLVLTLEEPYRSSDDDDSIWEKLSSLFGGHRQISREISGEINVPVKSDLEANIPYADVVMEGMKGNVSFAGMSNTLEFRNCALLQTIDNNYGNTTIRNSGGSLTLRGTSGTIACEDFGGELNCAAPYATIRLARITKSVQIESQSGDVSVADVGGAVTIRSNYSTISVANVSGMTDIESQSAEVKVKNTGGAKVRAAYSNISIAGVTGKAGDEIAVEGSSGDLSIENAKGNITVDNLYSSMVFRHITGNVRVKGMSGSVVADGVTGDWDSETKYCRVEVRDLSAKTVRVTNISDRVSFTLTTVPSSVDIKNQYEAVAFTMPSGFSGEVSLEAEYGSIETDLPLQTRSLSSSAFATGKVGTGNGRLSISTKSADIQLHQR
jgi:hypothetical protein